jgi:hypothetical protein
VGVTQKAVLSARDALPRDFFISSSSMNIFWLLPSASAAGRPSDDGEPGPKRACCTQRLAEDPSASIRPPAQDSSRPPAAESPAGPVASGGMEASVSPQAAPRARSQSRRPALPTPTVQSQRRLPTPKTPSTRRPKNGAALHSKHSRSGSPHPRPAGERRTNAFEEAASKKAGVVLWLLRAGLPAGAAVLEM